MKLLKTSFLLAAATAVQASDGITPIVLPSGSYYGGSYAMDSLNATGTAALIVGDGMMSRAAFYWSDATGTLAGQSIITGVPVTGYSGAYVSGWSADLTKAIVVYSYGSNYYHYVDYANGTSQPIVISGSTSAYPYGLSPNGLHVAGAHHQGGRDYGFVLSAGSAATTGIGASYASARMKAVSSDGSWGVGSGTSGSVERAFLWKRSDGSLTEFNAIAGLSASTNTYSFAASSDYSKILVQSWNGSGSGYHLWTPSSAQHTLIDTSSFTSPQVGAMSPDGNVVLINENNRVHLWTAAGWTLDLTSNLSGLTWANSYQQSYYYSGLRTRFKNISSDGGAVAGTYSNGTVVQPFRWTAATGAVRLFTGAQASWHTWGSQVISGNGLVMAGSYSSGSQNGIYRWTQANGLQTLTEWLDVSGVDVTPYSSWNFQYVNDITPDGSMILGTASNGSGSFPFIASASAGVTDFADWMSSVNNQNRVYAAGTTLASLPLEGAHHRPMMSFDRMGKDAQFWATGDFGSSSRVRDVKVTSGEMGVNKDIAPNTLAGIAIGRGQQNQDLALDGSNNVIGNYVLGEIDYRPFGSQWIVSLLGMVGSWDAKINRGYSNGGGTDYSFGQTDILSRSARLRVDAPVLFSVGGVGFSPYASYAVTQTVVEAYTEAGGALPASYDEQEHNATEARLGMMATKVFDEKLKLIVSVEGIHRFDGAGPALTGQDITGAVGFSLPGQAPRPDCVRLGVDVDYKLTADTLINVSAHASTVGEVADVSGAVSLRRAF
jgi:hypothetical protein